MADTIKLRAGKKSTMPELADREVAYCTDENAFYIGTETGNEKIGDVYIATYNVSTWDEVMSAIEAGKLVLVKSGSSYYVNTAYNDSRISFARVYQAEAAYITLTSAGKWASGKVVLAKTDHTQAASTIIFEDGESLQEKFDNGSI